MGLRCSLLGHDFGDAELERDREERGDEVVINIREVKACRRCGDERVLSENTEVRPVEPIEEVDADPDAAGGADTGAPADGTEPTPTGESGDDGAFIDDPGTGDADAAAGAGPATDPQTDDGVIMGDEESDPAERPAGEWPDAADTRVEERDVPANAGPEVDIEDGDESEDDTGAEIIEDDPETEAANEEAEPAEAEPTGADAASEPTESKETPESSEWPDPKGEDRGFDAEPGGGGTDVEFEGLAPERDQDAAATTPSESPSMEVDAETAFVCHECGFSEPTAKASLRAGDICPDCKKGYLREE